MDIQQYISSGIIEACVLGNASAEDMLELASLAAQYPEIKKEWDECQATIEEYATLHATPPPAFLKDKIWAILSEEAEINSIDAPNERESMPFQRENESKSQRFYKYLVAASLLLLAGSATFNFLLLDKNKENEKRFAALDEQQQKEIAINQEIQSKIESYQKSMELLSKPFVKTVPLAGVGTHTQYNALVIWDTQSKEVYLSLKDLPEPPKGKQYQLWGMVDGKPVDAGVYSIGNKSMQKMKQMDNVSLFAVTLEDEGGVPTPNMDQMYVAGKI